MIEQRHIAATLQATHWNKSKAAAILGIERSTLDRKIKKFGIRKESP
jgi:Nif-specific regulatory protein